MATCNDALGQRVYIAHICVNMAAWLSGSALVSSVNEVTLRRSRLVGPTWMGDRLQTGKPPRVVTSHSGQLNLLPSAERKMSRPTVQSAVMLCGSGVNAA